MQHDCAAQMIRTARTAVVWLRQGGQSCQVDRELTAIDVNHRRSLMSRPNAGNVRARMTGSAGRPPQTLMLCAALLSVHAPEQPARTALQAGSTGAAGHVRQRVLVRGSRRRRCSRSSPAHRGRIAWLTTGSVRRFRCHARKSPLGTADSVAIGANTIAAPTREAKRTRRAEEGPCVALF